MLIGLEKKIEGLIVFLSSDTQFIKEGPATEVDPRSLRIALNPMKRRPKEKQRRLFLVRRWSQLRFDFDSTVVLLPFDCNSTIIRLRYDHSTTYVTTMGLCVCVGWCTAG